MSIFVSALLIFWLRQLMNYTKEISHLDHCFLKALKALLTIGNQSNYIVTALISIYLFEAFIMLSVYQVLQSENNPGFSLFDRRSSTIIALLVCIIVLVIIYYAVYITTLTLSVRQIFMKDYAAIITFVLNQIMHIMLISGIFAGVFSTQFAYGGLQVFFLGLTNLYIFLLALLNWPVKVKMITQSDNS